MGFEIIPPPNFIGSGVGLALSGNTAGVLATLTAGTAVLAGGNNVTLSQNGQSITISAGAGGAGVDVSLAGNTSGTLALLSSGTAILAGGNNITLSQNGQSVTISGPNTAAQSVQTQGSVLVNGSSGSVVFTAGNNITLSQNASTITISGPNTAAQSAQSLGIYGSSQTVGQSSSSTVDARSFTHVGQGIISVGMSGGSLLISATTAQSLQTQNSVLVNGSSGSIVFTAGNNITLSQNASTITISGPNTAAQSAQTIGVYGSSQTVGQSSSSTLDARSFTHVGQGIVSVGMSAGSLLISATTAAQTNQTVGVYALDNTTGQSSSSTLDARTLSFDGLGIASVGFSAGKIIVSVPSGGGGGDGYNIVSMLTSTSGGGTLGATFSTLSGSIGLMAGSNITLSQTSNTINIIGPAAGGAAYTALTFQNRQLGASSTTTGQNSLWLSPMRIAAPVSASTLLQLVSITGSSTSNTGSIGISMAVGLWQQTQTTNLSVLDTLLWSGTLRITGFMSSSNSAGFTLDQGAGNQQYTSASANSNLGTQVWGIRNITWTIGSILSAGLYVFGWLISTSSVGASAAIRSFGPVIDNPMPSAQGLGFGGNTNASIGYADAGTYLTTTNALPATLNLTNIGQVMNRVPFVKIGAL